MKMNTEYGKVYDTYSIFRLNTAFAWEIEYYVNVWTSPRREENCHFKIKMITFWVKIGYKGKHFLPTRGQSPTLSQTITSSVHCSHLLSPDIPERERGSRLTPLEWLLQRLKG